MNAPQWQFLHRFLCSNQSLFEALPQHVVMSCKDSKRISPDFVCRALVCLQMYVTKWETCGPVVSTSAATENWLMYGGKIGSMQPGELCIKEVQVWCQVWHWDWPRSGFYSSSVFLVEKIALTALHEFLYQKHRTRVKAWSRPAFLSLMFGVRIQ